MKIRTFARHGAVAAALGAIAAGGLSSLPAPAHAQVDNPLLRVEAGFHDDSSCTAAGGTPSPPDTVWTDNGVAVSRSVNTSGTVTGATPGDVTHLSSKASASIAATRIGAGSATINANLRLAADAGTRPAGTTCNGHAYAEIVARGTFGLAQPRWATITVANDGKGSGPDLSVQLETSDGTVELQLSRRGSGSVAALLPAGGVLLQINASIDAYTNEPTELRSSLDSRIKIELQPPGLASATSGKGAAYTQLGARSCPAGTVGVAITKKAARKAKSVQVTVNGRRAVSLKGKKLKKRSFVLPAAPASVANVAARVTLKNGKVVEVRRSYLACS